MASFLEDGRKLADALQTLADREADAGTGSLDAIMPNLARLLGKKGFSKIMIPTTKNMSIMLPSADEFGDAGSSMSSRKEMFKSKAESESCVILANFDRAFNSGLKPILLIYIPT